MVTGIYGGAFDPVHNGHLALVKGLLSAGYCSHVKLVPAAHSPLKNKSFASGIHRINMLSLAFSSNSFVEIDELEIDRHGASWTIETVRTLTKDFPNTKFKLIIGQDNLASFNKWKNYEEILNLVSIIVVPRGDGKMAIPDYLSDKCQVLQRFSMPQSSSSVRKALRNGAKVLDDLPISVFEYIRENNLYDVDAQISGD